MLVGSSFFHQMVKVVIKLDFVVITVNFVVVKAVFGVILGDFGVIMFQSVVIIQTNIKYAKKKCPENQFHTVFLDNIS